MATSMAFVIYDVCVCYLCAYAITVNARLGTSIHLLNLLETFDWLCV